jgi:hypothetical protein
MAVDFRTFLKLVPFVTGVKKPVLIRGKHGIGKSETVYQYANLIGKPVVERRASQMTEGDLIGLPSIDGNSTRWNPPDWYKMACDQGVVLFLDEVDRATQEVRQGIFELTDSRKLNGWHLHPDTVIFAAVNGGTHGAQYQVGEMDPAELDRWTVFDLEPSVEDWLDFAKGKVDNAMWDFVNQNRTHLEHKGEYEPNKIYPSRRSWLRLNECLSFSGVYGNIQDSLPTLYELTCAFVGFEAAVAFRDFAEKIDRQVTVEDILDAGKLDKVKSWAINDHTAMIDKMAASGKIKPDLSDEQVKNLAAYAKLVPSEAFMALWKKIAAENTRNTVKLHPIVKDRLVKVLAPDQKK